MVQVTIKGLFIGGSKAIQLRLKLNPFVIGLLPLVLQRVFSFTHVGVLFLEVVVQYLGLLLDSPELYLPQL